MLCACATGICSRLKLPLTTKGSLLLKSFRQGCSCEEGRKSAGRTWNFCVQVQKKKDFFLSTNEVCSVNDVFHKQHRGNKVRQGKKPVPRKKSTCFNESSCCFCVQFKCCVIGNGPRQKLILFCRCFLGRDSGVNLPLLVAGALALSSLCTYGCGDTAAQPLTVHGSAPSHQGYISFKVYCRQ